MKILIVIFLTITSLMAEIGTTVQNNGSQVHLIEIRTIAILQLVNLLLRFSKIHNLNFL